MNIDVNKLELAICKQGVFLKDIAKRVGVSEQALRNIRDGKAQPRLATIGKIARALGVNVSEIIKDC